jgi:3-phosphoshikimate 1-carboxyvinyltransferase
MTSVIAASVFGGTRNIHDRDSIRTSFPTFLNIINDLKR